MDEATALDLLTMQCAASTYPPLTDSELAAILEAELGYTVWAAETAYGHGEVVQPTVRNGHLYHCIVAGTSAASEPTWPLYTNPDTRPGRTRPYWDGYSASSLVVIAQVGDGTVQWSEAGPDAGAGYSVGMVRRATYNAWLQKAAKASADYDFADGKATYSRSQVIASCERMALKWRPTGIA